MVFPHRHRINKEIKELLPVPLYSVVGIFSHTVFNNGHRPSRIIDLVGLFKNAHRTWYTRDGAFSRQLARTPPVTRRPCAAAALHPLVTIKFQWRHRATFVVPLLASGCCGWAVGVYCIIRMYLLTWVGMGWISFSKTESEITQYLPAVDEKHSNVVVSSIITVV